MQPTPYSSTTSYTDRLRGALMLEARTYREVEQDTNANGQAALTVVLAALAAGIGHSNIAGRDWFWSSVGTVLSSILQWVIFAFVAYWVGASLFSGGQTSVTPGQVLRTIGFAQAPKILLILGIIPLLGGIVGFVVFFWFIAAAIVALREAFEFDTGRAIGTGIVALIVVAIVDLVLSAVFGIGSALFGGLSALFRGAF